MERKLQTLEKWSQAQKRTATIKFDDLFTEDYVLELKGLGASSTLIDALTASEYSKAVGSDWNNKETWLEGERVHAVLTEQNEWLDAAGISEANYEGESVLKQDKIDVVHLQPRAHSNILANGKLIHNEVAGKTLVKMMQQWRQDNEPLDSFSQ